MGLAQIRPATQERLMVEAYPRSARHCAQLSGRSTLGLLPGSRPNIVNTQRRHRGLFQHQGDVRRSDVQRYDASDVQPEEAARLGERQAPRRRIRGVSRLEGIRKHRQELAAARLVRHQSF
jgi:hypothetical protein